MLTDVTKDQIADSDPISKLFEATTHQLCLGLNLEIPYWLMNTTFLKDPFFVSDFQNSKFKISSFARFALCLSYSKYICSTSLFIESLVNRNIQIMEDMTSSRSKSFFPTHVEVRSIQIDLCQKN